MAPKPDEQRLGELLDQLEEIMLAEGFAHLRIGALASRLRCSRSTLYRLAPSKDELFAVVFVRWARRLVEESRTEADKLDSPPDKIVRLGELIGAELSKPSPAFFRDASDNPVVAAAWEHSRATGHWVVRDYIEEGMERGVFRRANSAFHAYVVWAASRAARDPDLMQQFGMTSEEALAEIGRTLVYGLSPLPPEER